MSLLLKHTSTYPCSILGLSIFVELHNLTVVYGPAKTTDCSSYLGQNTCDVVGNLGSTSNADFMHRIRWEVERSWNASGYDSSSLTKYGLPQTGQRLDVQGFVYWSFLATPDAIHDYSGWYLELTAWQPARASTTNACSLSDFDQDGRVDIIDLSLVAMKIGVSSGQPGFTQALDPNNDGLVDIGDLHTVALTFGKTC